MKTNCPYCSRKYDLGKTPLGGKVKCGGCNNSFILPHSISILKKDGPPTEDIPKSVAAAIPPIRFQADPPRNAKTFSEYLVPGSLLIAFVLILAAIVCTFYNLISFETGIVLALSACVIILIPILINLREINRKLKK